MNDRKVTMMIDEYNIWTGIWSMQNPVDICTTLNIAIWDTNNAEIEQKAIDITNRLKLAIAIATNPLLTDQALKNILLLTGSGLPETVKVRELPPAVK